MRAALDRIDVVDIRVDVLREARVVLHRHFDRYAVFLGVDVDRRFGQRLAARVEELDELLEPLGRIERVVHELSLLVAVAPVGDVQPHALVQVCQFAHARRERLVVVFGDRENRVVGLERDDRSVILLRGFADHFHRSQRRALAELLAENAALPVHLGREQRRERVDARYAHAVQTARDLVAVLVELSSGVQYGQHDLQRRASLLFVEVGRNAPAVVAHGDRVVLVDRDVYVGAVSGQRLVDRVVDHLVYQVMESSHPDVPDVHGGTFAHRLEPFENLNAGCRILFRLMNLIFFLCAHRMWLIIFKRLKCNELHVRATVRKKRPGRFGRRRGTIQAKITIFSLNAKNRLHVDLLDAALIEP